MASPIVFIDIAGPNNWSLQDFYATIFGWKFDECGGFEIDTFSPLEGAIRKDPTEKRIHVGVPDVAETLRLVEANGGSVDTPRFKVPGRVMLGLFRDPAGNEMGLVEMGGDQPRVP